MEDRKQQFKKWVSANKLKKTSPDEFADLLERAFSSFLHVDVWSIDNEKEFATLRDNIISNKDFRKNQKKAYKLITAYGRYYFSFLLTHKGEKIVDATEVELQSAPVTSIVFKYEKERDLCVDFFSDKTIGELFYRFFEYSKDIDSAILLDVRTTIIGVKLDNERLRYYADKSAILKFSKIELEPVDLKVLSLDSLNECLRFIDMVNSYFATHKLEVSLLKNDELGYVHHKVFGFGKIISREESIIQVQFDGISEIKKMQSGHPSFVEISADEYANKIITVDNPNLLVPAEDNYKVQPKRITWDKYETALLIEGFWKIENKLASRSDVISVLSKALRKKAVNQGITIDDTFRNENGISMQLSNIAKAFFPNRPAMHRTAIFDEMAELYRTDKKQFNELLEEARSLVDGNTLDSDKKMVNWANLGNMSYTSPICVIYKGKKSSSFNSWAECYKYVLERLYRNFSDIFLDLAKNPSYTFLSRNKTDLRRPLEIAERVYAEGNRSATELVKSIKTFIERCDLNYSDIEIEFVDSKNISTTVPAENPENRYVVAISEADFYSFIKQRYIDNHKNDGKAHEAPHHAQKCVNMIRSIGKLLDTDLFALSKASELSDIRVKLDNYRNDLDYTWCIYALENYEYFVLNNHDTIQNKNSAYVSNESIIADDYKAVLSDSFIDGFSFENPLRKKKFIHRYEELLNHPFTDSEELYLRKINLTGFISENKVYLASIVDAELKSDIKTFIDDGLRQTPAIYYSAIYEAFNGRFNSLFSEDMLKNYLMFVFSSDYSFSPEYMTYVGAHVDLRKELIDVFMNCGRPMDIEEIYGSMPNISHSVIDGLLHDKDFVVNYRGKSYFYKDVFVIEDEQIEQIDQFLSKQLATKEQLTGSELYSFILTTMFDILDSNPGVTDLGIKNFLKLKLDNKYNFRGDVISKLGQAIDVKTLYRNFCEQRERFSFSELEEFRNSINQTYINWDAVMSASVRISQSSFIRRDLVTFNVEIIDNAISSYCPKRYASFVDVINYTDFPTLQVNWNSFVLESYLYMNSKKFKLVHATFNGDKPVGAIVNTNSNISSFDDLLVAIIRDKQLFEQEKAFTYLLENDYIRTRKVKNISSLIDKAKKEV